ncbi:MAG: flavodoxin [Bacteroidetes bacterium]|nr:MAG: flavodoxin [Bacteroidota bacterium]PIE87850.1 MAG: flavodoxin [Bacteroidota bacterium]
MHKIAIICSFNTIKSKRVAEIILEKLGKDQAELVNAEELTTEKFLSYKRAILSIPTWFYGELPNYWDEFVPAIEEEDLTGYTYHIYGLGDQKKYPYNFVDAIGVMATFLEERGATIEGAVESKGYTFEESKALRPDGLFYGLPLDDDNEAEKTEERITNWLKNL